MLNLYRIIPLEGESVECVVNLNALSINNTKVFEDLGPVMIEVIDDNLDNTTSGK